MASWRTRRRCWTPILAAASGRIVTTVRQRLRGRDVATGHVDWTTRVGWGPDGSHPVGRGRFVYVGAGRRLLAYDAGPE